MKHTTEMKTPARKLEVRACCELFHKVVGTESNLVLSGELNLKLFRSCFVIHNGVLVDKICDLLRRRVVCNLLSRIC